MFLRIRKRKNTAKVVRIRGCAVPVDVSSAISLDAIRPALIPGALQQKVKYVVGKGGILGKSQVVGKNKVYLAPVNR